MSNKMTRKLVASEYQKLRDKRDYETNCATLGEGVIRREDKGGELVIYKSRAFWCKDGYATVFFGKIPRHVSDFWVQKPFDREKDGFGNDIIVMTIEEWEAEGESVYHYIVNPDYNWKEHRRR